MNTRISKWLRKKRRNIQGFTLTEMLVTTLILTLASTLMVGGISAAIDTYHKTVNASNAQMVLSTTATKLRSELGAAVDVQVDSNSGIIYYLNSDNVEATIQNTTDETVRNGLEIQYYKGIGFSAADKAGNPYPLISNAAIIDENNATEIHNLKIEYGSVDEMLTDQGKVVVFNNLAVTDKAGHTLAKIADFRVLTGFSKQ